MAIKLLHDLVAIKEMEGDAVSAGGIQLLAAEKQYQGVVVGVGPGFHATGTGNFVPTIVKEGDVVLYNKKAGETVVFGNVALLVMPETAIIAILKNLNEEAAAAEEVEAPEDSGE